MNNRKLWSPKEDQAWVHDRFDEVDLHDFPGDNVSVFLFCTYVATLFLTSFCFFNCTFSQKEIREGALEDVVDLGVEFVVLAVVILEATDLGHSIMIVARTTVMFQRNLILTMITPKMQDMLCMTMGRTEFQNHLVLSMMMPKIMILFPKNLVTMVMPKAKRIHQE